MARLPYVDVDTAPLAVREALSVVPPLNIFRMLGHAETVIQPYLRLGAAILGELELDAGLRELAILQVARQSEADYEWVQHVAIGLHAGLTDSQIAAVEHGRIADDPALSETERAVLLFTEAVVGSPRMAGDTFQAVEERLSARQVVELLLTIGNYLMLARVMTVLELELDEPVGNTVVELSQSPPGGKRAHRRSASPVPEGAAGCA